MISFSHADAASLLDRTVGPNGERDGALDRARERLERLGLPAGTPVVLALGNGRELLAHWLGAVLAGLAPLAASPATPSARLRRVASAVGAGAIVRAGREPQLLPLAGAARHPPGTALLLTSGTSGMLTACVHDVGALLRNARRHAAAVGLVGGDAILVSLPLYYSFALVAQALAALDTGARLVVSGPPFAPAAHAAAVARHGVTSSSLTPTAARQLLASGRRLPAPLRMLTVGGDRLAPREVGSLLRRNPGLELYVTYGLTEAGPRVSTLAAHAEPAARHGSVGTPLDGVTVALRGGELLVSTDTAMLRAAGAPRARKALLAPGLVATGDAFRIDAAGYLTFAGRLSDFAVVRGDKVSLAGIRQYVQSLPGVVGCAATVARGEHVALDVEVDGDAASAEPAIRDAVMSFLLPAERPGALRVRTAAADAFRK